MPALPAAATAVIRLAVLLLLVLGAPARATQVASAPNYGDYAFIFNSLKDDRVFNSLASEAIRRFEIAHGVAVRQRVASSLGDTVRAVHDMAGRGVGTIILLGFQHTDALAKVAERYPKVRFTLIDGELSAPNVRSILFREEEAGYLAGVAAALATKTGRLGFIGGMPIPPVLRFGCGFIQGARSQRPDVAIAVRWLAHEGDGFRDAGRARSEARDLLADGVDVLFPAAGIAGLAALDEVTKAGRLGIGVDSNHNALYPGRILTSAVKRVDEAVARTLNDAASDRWTPGTLVLGLAENGVGWTVDGHNSGLVADLAATVDAARAAIVAGRTRVRPVAEERECRDSAALPHPPATDDAHS